VTIPSESTAQVAGRIVQNGRSKAYRPLPLERRREAFAEGVAAFARGDFFEAHELLEPAWMGSDDLTERELEQGLIKLAAAYVHAVRGNARGVVTNLTGARARLGQASADDRLPEILTRLDAPGLDVARLVADVEHRLERLASAGSATAAPVAGSGARARAARGILRRIPAPDIGVGR
jgi:predicted metal-dependent hydrolase